MDGGTDRMKLNEIQEELKGYFIFKNGTEHELAKRTDEDIQLLTDNITILDGKEKIAVTPLRYLLMQVNQQLLDPTTYVKDLREVIPIIDFKIFEDYDQRNIEIERHKALLEEITGSKSIFNRKKNYKLVYIKSHNHLVLDKEQVGYYIVKDNNVVPVSSELLEEADMETAVQIHSVDTLRNALKDDMENQYTEIYNEELRKWESLK